MIVSAVLNAPRNSEALPGFTCRTAISRIIGLVSSSVSGRIGWLTGVLDLPHVAPAIGLRTVEIPEAIHLCELAARERLTTPALDLRICGEVRDRAADVPRRFGDDEVWLLRDGVTPIRFADTVVVQHLLGAQPAGCHGDGGAAMWPKLLCLRPSHPDDRGLGEIVEQRHSVVSIVVVGSAVRHFDDQ